MKPRKSVWLSRVAVFALTLSVFSACNDAAGPEDVDPVQTSSTVGGAVSKYITGNQALENLDALGAAMGGALNAPNAVILKPQSGFGSFREFGSGIWNAVRDAQLRRGSSGASLMAIPVGLLGKTFVYNPVTGAYEIDQARTDAPATGVRFALYAINPVTRQPVDLNEIGYFDIIDTSSLPTVSVSLIAVVGTDTLINYSVTGTTSTTGITIDVTGFISDGTSQLDFTIALTGDDTSGSITIDLSFSGATVHVEFTDTAAGGGSGRIVVTEGGNRVVFVVSEDAMGALTGTISFNGTVVAQMSGTFEAPVFTNAQGGDLTAAEIKGIGDMFNAIDQMFGTVEELIDLAFVLLGLAGPEGVDPVQTSSTIESAVSQYITNNEALQNLDVLGVAMGGALNAPNAVLLKPQSGFGSFRQLGTDIGEAVRDAQLRRGSSGASLMAIPVGLLGKTLVYNSTNGKYEIDPARTDAPANGVRFAMYAVDPLLGQPVEPLNEIGYFDIIDTSSFPTVSVSLIAVVGTDTLINYSVTGTVPDTGGLTINVTGFISDGTSQLDFTIALTGDDTSGSITIDLSFSGATVHVEFTDTAAGGGSGRIVVTQGSNSVVFEVTEDAQFNLTGTISFNGTVVAQLSGTFDAPVFTNAAGGTLTAAEIQGIGDMFTAIDQMFFTVEKLLDLAFVLLGLGLI